LMFELWHRQFVDQPAGPRTNANELNLATAPA
jgi:hypothetical protein